MIFFKHRVPEKSQKVQKMHQQKYAKKWPKVQKSVKSWDSIVLVLLSAHAKRVGVSHRQDLKKIFVLLFANVERLSGLLYARFLTKHLFDLRRYI